MARLTKILVANRGEIACRIMATARERGYAVVAVYSDADSGAPHVAMADEAIRIGPAPAAESYLSIEKIIDAAKKSGADAIHPGYGFLAENAAFATACSEAGIVFVGPSAEAIAVMGNKAEAKRRMTEAGVPCVPGYGGEKQDDETLKAEAAKIGFPVMIKAASGGGGRGMRVVNSAEEMDAALSRARSESEKAFGSGELILEKAIANARHVEIQIMGDEDGNVVHLGERDCSVQRRHQKIIEESPCPVMTEELREAMGTAAVEAGKAIGYVSAGTVEFLLDDEKHFYFLEMNTRLQVEHPVTEMVTGLDLVGLQFDVAEGNPLEFTQDDVHLEGWAIEARLYAEDPAHDFLPQTGEVLVWEPFEGPDIRVDDGLEAGMTVSPHYDAMLGKIIARGHTRDEALARLRQAIMDTTLLGLTTNKTFLYALLGDETFAAGKATTAFLDTWTMEEASPPLRARLLGLAAAVFIERDAQGVAGPLKGWHSTGRARVPMILEWNGERFPLDVYMKGSSYETTVGDEAVALEILEMGDDWLAFTMGDSQRQARFAFSRDVIHLEIDGYVVAVEDVTYVAPETAEQGSDGLLKAPMNGRVILLDVAPGDKVAKGQVVVVVEAMKMENQVVAPMDGIVEAVSAKVGDQVDARQVLVQLTAVES